MRQDLSKKMKTNLERFRELDFEVKPILHVGAAEHLVTRGLIVKTSHGGHGRARAVYQITEAGRVALAAL